MRHLKKRGIKLIRHDNTAFIVCIKKRVWLSIVGTKGLKLEVENNSNEIGIKNAYKKLIVRA